VTAWTASTPGCPPGQVLVYARLLAGRVDESLGGRLRAAYLHGSAVLGGWQPERSDVDMLFVTENGVRGPEVTAAAAVLAAREPGVPGRGLECSVVSAGQAARPRAPWPFLLHVAHGPGEDQAQVVDGGARPGDRDLLMHYAVCRAAGWPVRGPAPAELIGSVPRPAILGYLAGELRWGIEHAGEAYAVLNACRAQVYLADGRIVSKVAGGRIALARGLGPAAVIGRALDQQQGRAPPREPGQDAADFVLAVAGALGGAADS
jgi:streptomycin 3"-adenylyltransferase